MDTVTIKEHAKINKKANRPNERKIMWILRLNDMRTPKIEIMQTVVRAETKEEIQSFLESETVESYKDDNWRKSFRKNGPLEWFNPPTGYEGGIVDVGTEESWVKDAIEAYNTDILSIPTI